MVPQRYPGVWIYREHVASLLNGRGRALVRGCRTLLRGSGSLASCGVGAADHHLGHLAQVVVPKVGGFLHPEAMAVGIHAVQAEVLPPDPQVEDLGHVGANLRNALLLRRRELGFLALAVGPMELVDHIATGGFESGFQRLAPRNVGLEVAGIVVDQGICVHLLQ